MTSSQGGYRIIIIILIIAVIVAVIGGAVGGTKAARTSGQQRVDEGPPGAATVTNVIILTLPVSFITITSESFIMTTTSLLESGPRTIG